MGVSRTPLEVVGVAATLLGVVGLGVLWGTGVVIGSIAGSTLPGTGGEGIEAILRSFPDIGTAWVPPISSGLVWASALVLVAAFAPLVWRLARMGRLADEGAQWAASIDLRRAGLLVSDRPLPNAEAEESADET
jgi:hypothetical protein